MNEEFAEKVYKTLVVDGSKTYRELYETTQITEHIVEYWKSAINLYSAFDNSQKEIFINILKQTIVDTISGVFGILDGSSTLSGGNYEFNVKIDGVDTEGELQDAFLEVVEEHL